MWVNGPPGAGKTTLAASYLGTRPRRGLWYRVDAGDADPATFFHYLARLVVAHSPRSRRPLPVLTPEYLGGLAVFTRRFAEAMALRLRPPFTLVFDDLHTLPGATPLWEILAALVDDLREEAELLLLSREPPASRFARLRANGALAAVDGLDLRLSPDELDALLDRRGIELDAPARDALQRESRGWAAGVVLLAQDTAVARPHRSEVDAARPQAVFDYFAREVLGGFPPDDRRRLARVGLLPEISAASLRALGDAAKTRAILESLGQRGFFCQRDPDTKDSFELHPLFRDFLGRTADELLGTRERHGLQGRAAEAFEREARWEHAASLWSAAGNHERLGALAVAQAPVFLATGRAAPIYSWLASLPVDTLSGWALFWWGVAAVGGDLAEARVLLGMAFERFSDAGDWNGAASAVAQRLDLFYIEWESWEDADTWLRRAEKLLSRGDALEPARADRLAISSFPVAFHIHPDDPHCDLLRERVEAIAGREGPEDLPLRAALARSLYVQWIGDTRINRGAVAQVRDATNRRRGDALARLQGALVEAIWLWSEHRGRESLAVVEEALRFSERSGVVPLDARLLAQGVYANHGLGDLDAARRYLERIEPYLAGASTIDVGHYDFLLGWHHGLRGNWDEAGERAERAHTLNVKQGVVFHRGISALLTANIALESGDFALSRERIDAGRSDAERFGSEILRAFADFLGAALAGGENPGSDEEAACLQRAFARFRNPGVGYFPALLRQTLSRLCQRALERSVEGEAVHRVIQAFSLDPPAPGTPGWPTPLAVATFGGFSIRADAGAAPSLRAKRPRELFLALVALGPREVPVEKLSEALWPDALGDEGRAAFDTTLGRLRRALNDPEVLTLDAGRLRLDWRRVSIDTEAFPRAEAAARGGEIAPLLALYRGPFLDGVDDAWVHDTRRRFHTRFVRAVCAWTDDTGHDGDRHAALERALAVAPAEEELHRCLIETLLSLGRDAEARRAYEACEAAVRRSLGVAPSARTRALVGR